LVIFFLAQRAQFFNYKNKNILDGISPHLNRTYIPNLRFLHQSMWRRTACGKTGKTHFGAFWGAMRPIIKLQNLLPTASTHV